VLRYLLDIFTSSNIRGWKKHAETDEQYEVRLYHHLEGLRFAKYELILESLRGAKPVRKDLNGWVRIVDFLYSLRPLSPKGSLKQGGRFNIGNDIDKASAKPFPALYLAENHQTAYGEKFGAPATGPSFSGADFALRSPTSHSSLVVRGTLQNVFDLRSHKNLAQFVRHIRHFVLSKELVQMAKELQIEERALITKPKELLASLMDPNWRFRPVQYGLPANSQLFGRMLTDAGFDGVIYKSTKADGYCIAAFPEAFSELASYVELRDPSPETAVKRLDLETLPYHLD